MHLFYMKINRDYYERKHAARYSSLTRLAQAGSVEQKKIRIISFHITLLLLHHDLDQSESLTHTHTHTHVPPQKNTRASHKDKQTTEQTKQTRKDDQNCGRTARLFTVLHVCHRAAHVAL
jgi:hypothetical protein